MRRRADQSEPRRRPRAGWNSTALSRANGFPKNTGHRNLFNEEGVPYETVLLWSPALVRSWVNQVHGSRSLAGDTSA